MTLTALRFKPGINREVTSYSNEGGWYDSDNVRFRFGFPEKIGGWEKYSQNTFQGTARRLHNWIALDSSNYLGIGTHLKYYIEEGQTFSDITPIRNTTAPGTDEITFSATDGSSIITVTDSSHGAFPNDFVTFTGAASLGGNITAALLNKEHQIVATPDGNSYTIDVGTAANSSDTGDGTFTDSTVDISDGTFTDSTVDTTNASATVTMDDTSAVTAGDSISGVGIPASTTVLSVDDATTLTISANATADGTDITATFFNQDDSRTVTMDDTSSVQAGYTISGSGIPAGATVVSVDSGTQLTISANATADSTNITATFNGVVAAYQLNTGLDSQVGGNGWGSSTWSRDTWGSGSSLSTATELRLWSHDNFGEDLIINPRDGKIYYWDKSSGLSSRAVEISTLGGANQTPVIAKQVLVSDADRHVIAFGTNPQGSSDQDPLLIRFSNQESITEWEATATTTAGDLRLGSGSEFVQAIETKREILVWTDTALHSMRFIGPPFTFGITQLSNNITIMGPNAAAGTEDFVFWMGIDNFYVYAGQTQQLPCPVKEYVFNDFNDGQKDKVVSGINSEFGEVWWFYPSQTNALVNGGTGEIDRYVVYNYNEKAWYYGSLVRTAWLDRGTRPYPLAANGGYLYNHELGYDADGSALESYIVSAPMDMQDGDKFVYMNRLIPDMTFEGSGALSSPQVTITVEARNFPGTTYDNTASGDVIRTVAAPVELYTDQIFVRTRGRSFAFRVESDSLGTKWKLGTPRVDLRPDGKR